MSKRLLQALADATPAPAATDLGLDVTAFMDLELIPRYLEPGVIELDPQYQKRLKVDDNKIAEYADLWSAGANLGERDPIVVFYITDQKRYVSIDGWHRIKGWIVAHGPTKPLAVQVATGTATQANAAALGANARHGIARTNEEKRAAVDEALILFTKPEGRLSNETIAKIVGVSSAFVGNRRKELERANTIMGGSPTVASNGRLMETGGIGAKPQPKSWVAPGPVGDEPDQGPASDGPALKDKQAIELLADAMRKMHSSDGTPAQQRKSFLHSDTQAYYEALIPVEQRNKIDRQLYQLARQKVLAEYDAAIKSAPRPLTLDESIAVIWRVLRNHSLGGDDVYRLDWIKRHNREAHYTEAINPGVTFEQATFNQAWANVSNELQGNIARAQRKAQAAATPAPSSPPVATPATPAPITPEERRAKFGEPMILGGASFMMVGPHEVSIATSAGEVVIRLEDLRAYLFLVDGEK